MFRSTNLAGFGNGVGQFQVSITDTDTTPVNTDTPTFSGMHAGRPHPNRLLIPLFHYFDNDTADQPSTAACTVGGVGATGVLSYVPFGGGLSWGGLIQQAAVADGYDLDVTMTLGGFSGTVDSWACTLVRAVNLSSNAYISQDFPFNNNPDGSYVSLDTTGAKFAVVVVTDQNTDLSARTPYSDSAGSVLELGHRTTTGLAFIDRNPPQGTVVYSINSYAANNPFQVIAACWG